MKRIFGSCDGHIHQTPLLLQVVAVAGGTVWQQPFRTADHEHMLEFEAFCGVDRGYGDTAELTHRSVILFTHRLDQRQFPCRLEIRDRR